MKNRARNGDELSRNLDPNIPSRNARCYFANGCVRDQTTVYIRAFLPWNV
jgi:hypothetical protein